MRQADGIDLRPFIIDLPLKHPKVAGASCVAKVPVLLPHEFLHCLHCNGRVLFEEAVGNDADIAEFWRHERKNMGAHSSR